MNKNEAFLIKQVEYLSYLYQGKELREKLEEAKKLIIMLGEFTSNLDRDILQYLITYLYKTNPYYLTTFEKKLQFLIGMAFFIENYFKYGSMYKEKDPIAYYKLLCKRETYHHERSIPFQFKGIYGCLGMLIASKIMKKVDEEDIKAYREKYYSRHKNKNDQ